MKNDYPPIINGDGTFSRDFTYVENAVHANLLALTTENQACFGEIFNIGCGGQYTLHQLVECINKSLHKTIQPVYGSPREGDIPHSNADITKAQTLLGYRVRVDFETGIQKLLKEKKNIV